MIFKPSWQLYIYCLVINHTQMYISGIYCPNYIAKIFLKNLFEKACLSYIPYIPLIH